MKVAVLGLGYVGTVTAAGLASRGHTVTGVDVDEAKVAAVRSGHSPVVEAEIDELVGDAVRSGALTATTDPREALEECELSLVCVGTPSAPRGETDLTYVKRALIDLLAAMASATPPVSGHHSVVIRSTVPPGTGDSLVAPMFAEPPGGWSVGTAMCPEFLREGCSVQDFFAPPFVVLGAADDATRHQLEELFAFLGLPPHHVAVGTAEALKYACNAFHATKVSFANEIGRVLRSHGVDSREVMSVFCEDRKLNVSSTYLRPGFAFGGSCLPKDLRSLLYLARMDGVDLPLLSGTLLTNELHVRDVTERILDSGSRCVCLLGLSFKAGTDDLRESALVDLAERLIGKGVKVQIFDPIVNPDRLVGANLRQVKERLPHLNALLARSPGSALDHADVVVVSSADAASLAALRDSATRTDSTHRMVLDLHGRLGADIESLPGYEGVAW